MVFLGDSFTFGEGVRLEDTYPEVAQAHLNRWLGVGRRFDSINLAVGGYNTGQERQILGCEG